jgi:hypothetical protein
LALAGHWPFRDSAPPAGESGCKLVVLPELVDGLGRQYWELRMNSACKWKGIPRKGGLSTVGA